MTSVVFSTPGLIPIEAFTTFGVNAKPCSNNPIGYFGTGLKYAIAVCLRFGQEVAIWRGKDKYTFYVKKEDFRGKEFGMVRMKVEKPSIRARLQEAGLMSPKYGSLPFTTELGKNWELWQAFREFETNTRDEGGTTFTAVSSDKFWNEGESSHIVVTGQRFVDEFHDMERNFLKDGLTERSSSERIQILDRPSKHIYYRGMRIMDLKEEAAYTYNFLMHVDLTEDRTAKYPAILEGEIIDAIKRSEDPKVLRRVIPHRNYSGPTRYEHGLGYARSYFSSATPSEAFLTHAKDAKDPSIREIWDQHQPTVKTVTRLGIQIPVAGLEDHELKTLSELLWSFKQGAVLIDESMTVWKNGTCLRVENQDDDVPF